MKVLYIGNSYTYFNELPALFRALAEENGHPCEVGSVTKGGRKLFQYLDLSDEYSEKLDECLAGDPYDVVFLQEQSLLPLLDYDAFADGVRRMREKLGNKARRVILYATWGRKEGSKDLAEHGWTRSGMTAGLAEAYTKAAEAISAEVAHVGRAFLALNEAHPELDLHHPDLTHPSPLGSALAAIVQYRSVFGVLPERTESLGLDRTARDALLLSLQQANH